MKKGVAWVVAAFLVLALLAGCDPGSLPGSEAASRAAKRVTTTGPGYEVVEGTTGPGALYALYYPTAVSWNGSLVLYAHGYMDPAQPVALPSETDEAPFTELMMYFVSQGYGVAYSSYSENGWAVKDGITRTRQLIGLYASRFGRARHTYIIGVSMGGAVAEALAEKNPELVDGVVSISGPLGGPIWQFGYLLNARAIFDYYYPGVVPGDAYHVPVGTKWSDVQAAMGLALYLDPSGAAKVAAIDQVSMPYESDEEFSLMIGTALWFSVVGTNDALARTHGHIPVGNAGITYTDSEDTFPYWLPGELDTLNEKVERYTATPDAENYLEHWYVPTGKLQVPVVTLHNLRDPGVPYSHEAQFHATVAAAGKLSMLWQVDPHDLTFRFGHCIVTPEEVIGAFGIMLLMAGQ